MGKTDRLLLAVRKLYIATLLVFCCSLTLYTSGFAADRVEKTNPVWEYFDAVEIQYDGEIQLQAILSALNDIMTLSPKTLAERRYRDSADQTAHDLPTLIHRHFVPDDARKTLGPDFYQDVKAANVQKQIEKIRNKIVFF